jgi:hypothetical protein
LLDARRAEGRRMSLDEAMAVIVPLCMDLQQRHSRGERLYVHPSGIAPGGDGVARLDVRLAGFPTHPHDRHCIAPELQRSQQPGDACASVYSVGAILYEMVTGRHVGPAMTRPRDFDASLPEALEVLIGKAIIGDRAHRPADLGALASAMYHLAPQGSIHPPEVSAGRLDQSAQLEVDVRFSMLPPGEIVPPATADASGVNAVPIHAPTRPVSRRGGGDPFGAPIIDRRSSRPPNGRRVADDPTARLAALKARLESDPRPRYVVSKDKMDHGPFTAVELLQQIASYAFVGDHSLRDEISGESQRIAEWEEFAPFAEQAGLLREKRAEEKAVVRAASADRKRGFAKTILAGAVVAALAGALALWFFKVRGTHSDEVRVAGDRVGTVEVNGDIKGRNKKPGAGGPGGGGGGGGGGGPGYSGGTSYENVLNGHSDQVVIGQTQQDTPDLTNAQLAAPLRHASFITGCGAPDDMKVTVRVAVRMGRAVGVTVGTNPPSGGVAACVDRSVRMLQWPVSPKTDFVTTSY